MDYNDAIKAQEDSLEKEDDYSETPPSDITFNELRSCADLIRMHKTGQLIIKPDFQREFVWPNPAQTWFIDSLVKQLPIPSMCLDYKTDKRIMVDGLQDGSIAALQSRLDRIERRLDIKDTHG